MKQIDLDDDLVDWLQDQERVAGVSPSEFLKRALRGWSGAPKSQRLRKPRHRGSSSQMAVFLRILGEVHGKYPDTFDRIGNIQGRPRIYFARSSAEIEASGKSTMPVEVPTTGWWVVGNTSTRDKAKILARVFQEVGCAPGDTLQWESEFGSVSVQTAEALAGEVTDHDPFKI